MNTCKNCKHWTAQYIGGRCAERRESDFVKAGSPTTGTLNTIQSFTCNKHEPR